MFRGFFFSPSPVEGRGGIHLPYLLRRKDKLVLWLSSHEIKQAWYKLNKSAVNKGQQHSMTSTSSQWISLPPAENLQCPSSPDTGSHSCRRSQAHALLVPGKQYGPRRAEWYPQTGQRSQGQAVRGTWGLWPHQDGQFVEDILLSDRWWSCLVLLISHPWRGSSWDPQSSHLHFISSPFS